MLSVASISDLAAAPFPVERRWAFGRGHGPPRAQSPPGVGQRPPFQPQEMHLPPPEGTPRRAESLGSAKLVTLEKPLAPLLKGTGPSRGQSAPGRGG